jgi:hypothetical protein
MKAEYLNEAKANAEQLNKMIALENRFYNLREVIVLSSSIVKTHPKNIHIHTHYHTLSHNRTTLHVTED